MFTIQNFLDKKQICYLLEYWNLNHQKIRHHEQYYNLFNLEMLYGERKYSEYNDVIKTFEEINGNYVQKHYMLNYTPGSFCRMHHDATSNQTFVTLLEDENLLGGQIITGDEKRCIEMQEMKIGQTMVYDKSLHHGVAKVRQGNRKVFVIWF